MGLFSFILPVLLLPLRLDIHHMELSAVSFTGLSCYLIYVGLYSSAVTVSQDTTLRLSIKKSLTDQAKFLDSMGSAHMEQELQSTVIKIAKKHSDVLTEKTGVEASMTDNDIKDYMAMVLNEIHKSYIHLSYSSSSCSVLLLQ